MTSARKNKSRGLRQVIEETRELPAYLQFKKSSLLIKGLKRVKGIFQLHVILRNVYFLCKYKEKEIL